jgi:hypothetical protein
MIFSPEQSQVSSSKSEGLGRNRIILLVAEGTNVEEENTEPPAPLMLAGLAQPRPPTCKTFPFVIVQRDLLVSTDAVIVDANDEHNEDATQQRHVDEEMRLALETAVAHHGTDEILSFK